jgi:parvulin-like peptidyl-prolyl isomerase
MAKPSNTPRIITKKHIARLERERRQVTIVRTVAIAMIAVVLLLIGYGYLDLKYLQLQKPVAEVNGDKIAIADWQERVQLQRINLSNLLQQYQFYQQNFGMDTSQQQQQIMLSLQSPETLGQQVIDAMIDEVLIRQEAVKRGITVSGEEVEQAIQGAYNFFPNGTPTPTITPTSFEYPTLTSQQLTIYPATATPTEFLTFTPEPTATRDLSVTPTATATTAPPTPTFVPEAATATSTPYTLEGFKTEYQTTLDNFKKYGISEKTLRTVYENQLLREKVLAAVTADLPSSEEQVWARHILLETEAEAQAAYEALIKGADFAKIAQDLSKDTGSKSSGGDLGWFGKGMMVSEFENAAFSQKIGEIGKPVQSQFGYHIIQVIDRRELPLSASQLQQNRQTAFSDWLTKTRESSTITTNDLWKQHIPPTPDFLTQQ